MRYHVIVNDSRDIDSEWGPESALIEDDRIEICRQILADYLVQFQDTIYAWKIIDIHENRVIDSWHK